MEKFGWPMGPAYLGDVVGLDTAVHAGKVMADAYPDRMAFSDDNPMGVMAGLAWPKKAFAGGIKQGGTLKAIPYSEAYADRLKRAALLLREQCLPEDALMLEHAKAVGKSDAAKTNLYPSTFDVTDLMGDVLQVSQPILA